MDLSEMTEKERQKLKMELAAADALFQQEHSRDNRALVAENQHLPELLARALAMTKNAQESEHRHHEAREAFEKATAAATEAWNDYVVSFTAYVETNGSSAIAHSDVTRLVRNEVPVSATKEYRP